MLRIVGWSEGRQNRFPYCYVLENIIEIPCKHGRVCPYNDCCDQHDYYMDYEVGEFGEARKLNIIYPWMEVSKRRGGCK